MVRRVPGPPPRQARHALSAFELPKERERLVVVRRKWLQPHPWRAAGSPGKATQYQPNIDEVLESGQNGAQIVTSGN